MIGGGIPPGGNSVFDGLTGQEAVVAQLRSALAGSMTHAWLFTGPPGSGRSVAARAFAAAPAGEITEYIKDRIREVLPDPVPRATEAATGSFPAIPDHVPDQFTDRL